MLRYDTMEEKDFHSSMILNYGPSHPATHGTLRLKVELEGELILGVEPEQGYLHTGFEKLGEHLNYNQFVTVIDRANYMSPLNNNIGHAQAVEELFGIEITPRAQYIRVLLAELSSIADHIVCVCLFAMDLGAFSVFLWCFHEREKLYDIFEKITGTRMTTSYTRIGGLMFDLPDGIEKEIEKSLETIPRVLNEVEWMLTKNRIWIDRTKGIGVIDPKDAVNWGITGPLLRATGVNYDIRRKKPYLCYNDLDFEVALDNGGDSFARYNVRLIEMRESLKIVKQVLDKMPGGDINVFDYKTTIPRKDDTYNDMESLIHHFKMIMPGHSIAPEIGELYSSTEVPNGELGYHIVSNGTDKPYRIRIRPPSQIHYQIVSEVLTGHYIGDIPCVLGSFNIIAGELDR